LPCEAFLRVSGDGLELGLAKKPFLDRLVVWEAVAPGVTDDEELLVVPIRRRGQQNRGELE
jgi:hypothetical protein